MKILCISNYYPPHFEGGYEISVKETMDYMVERGHQVYVLCGHRGLSQAEPMPSKMIPGDVVRALTYIDYQHASFQNKHTVEIHNFRSTIAAINMTNPDIVYIANMKAISIAPVIAVQKRRIPRVFDLGDIWLRTYTAKDKKSRAFRFIKWLLPFTIGGRIYLNPVIVLSDWMKEEVTENYGSRIVYKVPRGISLPEIPLRPTQKPLKYIFAGRIEPLKGLDICIRAIADILKVDPSFPFTLDIYGEEDKDYAEKCKALIQEYGLTSRFHFMGKSTKLRSLLPEYDVMLMPTMAAEAFGRVVIEAMAAKVIVIATNAFGPKEIIQTGVDGYLFERGSHSHLAEIIKKIDAASPIELDQVKTAARQKVQSTYEISLVKKQVEIILENIVNKRTKNR